MRTLRTADDLVSAGLIEPATRDSVDAVGRRYAIAITPELASLVDPRDPADPIARQFVPTAAELSITTDERGDPIGDDAHAPVAGIVHRYPDRVLLKLASVCPVYCRFCFRRESVGGGGPAMLSADQLAEALGYVRATPAIFEVIVTGGDPLVLSPRRLREVSGAIAAIPHVQVLRWHTRVPVVDAARVTPALADAIIARGKATYLAVHANHPREITEKARGALVRLAEAGVGLVSQTVLLKGVNDDAATLERLFRDLLAAGVKPYYLHHADLAPGTAHLRTSIEQGQAIMAALRGRLSGLALPVYVLDIPGGYGKVPVTPPYVGPRDAETGLRELRDPSGRLHLYAE